MAVLLTSDWLTVAWLGDSQAMLVRQGQPVTLMDPHKPEREVRHNCRDCGVEAVSDSHLFPVSS